MDFSESELYSIIKSQQIAIDSLKQQIRQLKNDIKIEESYLLEMINSLTQVANDYLGLTEEEVGAKGLEMHHNFLTIFDIALLITEHVINTVGKISTFDLMYLLEIEHREHRVPLVMLSETAHQMYHNNEDLIIPASMTTGNWLELLQRYNKGITLRIAEKVSNFINESINNEPTNSQVLKELLSVKEYAESWGRYNEYGDNRKSIISDNSNQYNYNMPYLEQKY